MKQCINGHALTEQTQYIRKDRPGKWDCRKCMAERMRRRRAKEKANESRPLV